MEFKYELKGEDGSELFEEGLVLAWQYLGVGFGTYGICVPTGAKLPTMFFPSGTECRGAGAREPLDLLRTGLRLLGRR